MVTKGSGITSLIRLYHYHYRTQTMFLNIVHSSHYLLHWASTDRCDDLGSTNTSICTSGHLDMWTDEHNSDGGWRMELIQSGSKLGTISITTSICCRCVLCISANSKSYSFVLTAKCLCVIIKPYRICPLPAPSVEAMWGRGGDHCQCECTGGRGERMGRCLQSATQQSQSQSSI